MSKLGDRIRKAGRVEPAPLGFAAAAARTTSASMLVIVDAGGDLTKAAGAVKGGADAVILDVDAGKLRGAKLPDGAVIGVAAGAWGREEAAATREAGADFAVVDESSRGEPLLDDKLGFVMAIGSPADVEDTRLRLLGEMSLDGLLIDRPAAPMKVSDVLELRRLAGLARAPLLVRTDAKIGAGHLQLLRESGAIGVVLPASEAPRLGDLKKTIESLPQRGRRHREEKADVLVPAQATMGGGDEDDDYDED